MLGRRSFATVLAVVGADDRDNFGDLCCMGKGRAAMACAQDAAVAATLCSMENPGVFETGARTANAVEPHGAVWPGH